MLPIIAAALDQSLPILAGENGLNLPLLLAFCDKAALTCLSNSIKFWLGAAQLASHQEGWLLRFRVDQVW